MKTRERIWAFLFPADSGRWLSILKAGLGMGILFYTLSLQNDWIFVLGGPNHGLLGREVGDAMTAVQGSLIPRLGCITFPLTQIGFTESVVLSGIWWTLLTLGCLLILRPFSRPTAFLAWFLQLACAKSSGLLSYGVDNMITIGLFYLMIAPRSDPDEMVSRLGDRALASPQLIGFHRRVFQIHLCLIYFFSGLTKCLGAGWWNGSNMWSSLTIPPFDLIPQHWVASCGFLLAVLGIAVCLLETTYPFLIWWPQTRRPVLYSICAMHLGIGLIMGMYLFGGIMIVLNVAAFWLREEGPETKRVIFASGPISKFAFVGLRKRLPLKDFQAL
jgi:hypothetical protein